MTQKQQKALDAATAELESVRSHMASAQSDIDAAQTIRNEAQAALTAADKTLDGAKLKLADLKPYEELALKKTRKVLDEALPGVANGPRLLCVEVRAERVDLSVHNHSGGFDPRYYAGFRRF